MKFLANDKNKVCAEPTPKFGGFNPSSGHWPPNSEKALFWTRPGFCFANNFFLVEVKNRVCLEKMQRRKSWSSPIPLLLQISLALVSCAAPRFTLYTVDFALRAQLPESKSCAQCPSEGFRAHPTVQTSFNEVQCAYMRLGSFWINIIRRDSRCPAHGKKRAPFVEHHESRQTKNRGMVLV